MYRKQTEGVFIEGRLVTSFTWKILFYIFDEEAEETRVIVLITEESSGNIIRSDVKFSMSANWNKIDTLNELLNTPEFENSISI